MVQVPPKIAPPVSDELPFTRRLCLAHRSWAIDATDGEELPIGWQTLVSGLFGAIAFILRTGRYERLVVRRVGDAGGTLAIDLSADRAHAVLPRRLLMICTLVEQARRQSLATCSVCGSRCARGVGLARGPLCDLCRAALAIGASGPSTTSRLAAGATRDPPPSASTPAATDPTPVGVGEPEPPGVFALYDLDDVRAALGGRLRQEGAAGVGTDDLPCDTDALQGQADGPSTDQRAYLRRILDDGEAARWRRLAAPDVTCLDKLDELHGRAPHLADLTNLVRLHLKAALTIGLPVSMPAIMLLGEPGTGKTWFLARLARLFGVPFRRYPMTGQSLADGLCGAHPVWRNSEPGLVAKLLLSEPVGNGVVFVDEIDKAGGHHDEDPYLALYDLLEPEGARAFKDEYLGFECDASHLIWVVAGNDGASIPAPILDRLTVVDVPQPDEAQTRAIAASIYDDGNAARRRFFVPSLDEPVLERLLAMSPRTIRKAVADAMTRAAADGRRRIRPDDVVGAGSQRRRIGFR